MTSTLQRPAEAQPQPKGPEHRVEPKPGRVQRFGKFLLTKLGRENTTPKQEKRVGAGTIGGAVAGVSLATALLIGPNVTAAPENPGTTQGQEDPGSGVEDPIGEEEPGTTPEVGGDTLDTITIELGQSDEQAALDIQTQLSNWKVAGADGFIDAWTQHAMETGDASNEAYNVFVKQYVQEQSKPYLIGLFGVESVEELPDQSTKEYVTGTMTILEGNLYLVLRTDGKYEVETQLTSSSAAQSGQGRTFTINTEIVSNAVESGAAGIIRENNWVDVTGEKAIVTASTWVDSESERISSISIELAN